MEAADLLRRITSDPAIFGGKPIVRGKRLAVEHVLSMLAAGDSTQDLIAAYPFLEAEDVRACMLCAYKLVAHERVDHFLLDRRREGSAGKRVAESRHPDQPRGLCVALYR